MSTNENKTQILWSPAGRGDAASWQDVMKIVQASQRSGSIEIEVLQEPGDPPLIIPPGTHDLGIGAEIVCPRNGDPTPNAITVQDGATIRNLWNIEGACGLIFQNSQPNAWQNDPTAPGQPPVYRVGLNATIVAAGTAPIIATDPVNPDFVVAVLFGGSFLSLSGQPWLLVGQAAVCLLVAFDLTQPSQPLDPNMVQSLGGAAVLVFEHDDTPTYPFLMPGFAGSILNAPFGVSGGSGPSSFRPFPFGPALSDGCMYYENAAAIPHPPKPIWYDLGTGQWVDATGAVVPP